VDYRRKWHSIAYLSNNEMCGLKRRTPYQKIKNSIDKIIHKFLIQLLQVDLNVV
jgi:hypothetical protein